MQYKVIFEKIDDLIKQNFPNKFVVKITPANDFKASSELSIETAPIKYDNDLIYHKTFEEINLEIQKIGFSKYINDLRLFLGKISKKVFSRGDLFWASNDNAKGSEQKGYRPYLIVSNNLNNNYSSLLTVVPITTQHKKDLPTHKTVMINDVQCTALCEQITCVEKSDMIKYIRSLTKDEFKDVEEGIKIQLALNTKNTENMQKIAEKTKKKGVFVKFLEKIKKLFKKEKKNEEKI